MSFGGDPFDNIKTLAWPFGRTSANCTGSMTLYPDGSYFVSGELEFLSDTYSWKADGENSEHNFGIKQFGSSYNWKGSDGHGGGKWQLSFFPSIVGVGAIPLHKSCTPFQSSTSIIAGSILWSQASKLYSNGEMPVDYSRKFYFYIVG